MSGPGRGRGEGKLPSIEELTRDVGRIHRSTAPGSIPVLQVEQGSSSGSQSSQGSGKSSTGEKTHRGRGGFKSVELRTIPSGITEVKAPANSNGDPVNLATNFIKIEMMKDCVINQYRVDFQPNIEAVSIRQRLFREATKEVFKTKVIFDGASEARSSTKLDKNQVEKVVKNPQAENENIKITIKHTGTVPPGSFEQIRVYNMHMKQFLRALGYFSVTRTGSYVHTQLCTQIGNDLMTVRGYRTSTNVHEGGQLLMNLESVHKLMQKRNVLEVMMDIKRNAQGGNLQQLLRTQLTGKLVVTMYNKIVYRIEDLNFTLNPTSTFHDERNKKDVSYKDYYKTRYNVSVNDLKQPLLLVVQNNQRRGQEETGGPGKEIYLIPELCNIAGLTDQQRNDNRLKVELIKASQIPPSERVSHMLTFLEQLHSNNEVKKSLQEWGYKYETRPVLLKGRLMPRENIGVGSKSTNPPSSWPKANPDGGFENSIMRDNVAKKPDFPKLVIIIGQRDLQNEQNIVGKLRTGLGKVGALPQSVDFVRMQEGDSSNNYTRALRNLGGDTSAAIVIMSNQNKEKYDAIKKQASCEMGLITQVVTSRLMMDDRKASGAGVKIGIQLAAKLGGEPWYVNLPLTQAMVCGYDTYHDTTNRGRSFGAFVASMNSKFSRWYSKADTHDRLEELSAHMTENLSVALKRYRDKNNRFPDRCIIFRDGVGDGQLEHVFNIEVKQIKKAVASCDPKIRMTFIVVNKRIGARFYLKEGSNFSNPLPGTVIDDVVTRQQRYDFYLISQSTRHGTVTPTYYNVMHDDSGLNPDKLQMLSFKMCFLYYNWTGTVRVPAPCQYAHKLALLCGEHLHTVPHSIMDDKLHFL